MSTENRSSNTEMVSELLTCPFCGEKPQITKHHREDIYSFIHRCQVLGPISWGFREDQQAHIEKWNARAQPAPQPNAEPIAWMVGTAFWWTKEEAERDAAETGLPIVGLGPMSGAAPAEQRQGEPVAAKGATFMGEPNFQHSIEWYREGISKHWKKICNLRAEVERLRAALKFYADREHYHFESGNWDTVSGEPLNILWRGEEPDFIEDGTVARAALERQS